MLLTDNPFQPILTLITSMWSPGIQLTLCSLIIYTCQHRHWQPHVKPRHSTLTTHVKPWHSTLTTHVKPWYSTLTPTIYVKPWHSTLTTHVKPWHSTSTTSETLAFNTDYPCETLTFNTDNPCETLAFNTYSDNPCETLAFNIDNLCETLAFHTYSDNPCETLAFQLIVTTHVKPWHSTLTTHVRPWHSTLIVTTPVKPWHSTLTLTTHVKLWHSTHVVLTGGFGHQYRQLLQSFNFDVEGSDVFVQAVMARQQCLQRSKQSTDDGRQRAQTSTTFPPTPLRSIPKTEVLVVIRLSGDWALSLRSPLPPPSQPHPNSQHTEKRVFTVLIRSPMSYLGRTATLKTSRSHPVIQAKPSQAKPGWSYGLYGINKVTDELSRQNSNAEDQLLSPCDSGPHYPAKLSWSY